MQVDEINDTLYNLLFDSAFRANFQRQDFHKRELEDYSTLDWKEVGSFGENIERKVFDFPLILDKSLASAFATVFQRIDNKDFRRSFLNSNYFHSYSDLNHDRDFLSLEEDFYSFVAEFHPSLESIARKAFLALHMQNLALHSNPAFRINPNWIANLRAGYCSIQKYPEEIHLYACAGGNFISGPIDADTATLIVDGFILKILDKNALPENSKAIVQELERMGF